VQEKQRRGPPFHSPTYHYCFFAERLDGIDFLRFLVLGQQDLSERTLSKHLEEIKGIYIEQAVLLLNSCFLILIRFRLFLLK
jgi:hypothetical protein